MADCPGIQHAPALVCLQLLWWGQGVGRGGSGSCGDSWLPSCWGSAPEPHASTFQGSSFLTPLPGQTQVPGPAVPSSPGWAARLCPWLPVKGARSAVLFSVAGLLFSLSARHNMPIRCFPSEVSTPR